MLEKRDRSGYEANISSELAPRANIYSGYSGTDHD
jgi:hypothetical protein